jgi:hypothetical protein
MATKTVRIKLEQGPSGPNDRKFVYTPANPVTLSWKKNTRKIQWLFNGTFSIHIMEPSPFKKSRYSGNGKIEVTLFNRSVLAGGLQNRAIKYFVAVCDPDTDRVWTDDPILIIEP